MTKSRVSKKCLNTRVHSSTIHSTQEVAATQMFNIRWMAKEAIGDISKGRRAYSVLYCRQTLRTFHQVKDANHKRTDTIWFHQEEGTRVARLTKTERRVLVASHQGRREWVGILGANFQFFKKKFWVLIAQQWKTLDTTNLYTLTVVKKRSFMLRIFYYNFKNKT